jgi:hypothetical protein
MPFPSGYSRKEETSHLEFHNPRINLKDKKEGKKI